MKRTLSILLTVIMTLSLFTITQSASAETYGDFTYNVCTTADEGTYISITKYTGSANTITFPEKIDNKPVKYIDSEFDNSNINIEKVNLPSTLVALDPGSFCHTPYLKECTISNNPYFCSENGVVYSKDKKTLVYCPRSYKAEVFTVPSTVTALGKYSFLFNESLKEVKLSTNITTIEKRAFYGANVETMTIPASIKVITDSLFEDCYNLKTVNLPDGLKSIEDSAFYGCRSLESIKFPESLESVGSYIFYRNEAMKELYIPAKLTSIDNFSFVEMSGLEAINVDPDNTNYSSVDGALYSKDHSIIYRYPENKADTTYTMPETVITINTKAFSDAKNLTKINFNNTLKEIGLWAFENCKNVTEFKLPSSVKNIYSWAFEKTGIKTFVMPGGVTETDGYLFYDSALESIYLPATIKKMDKNTFNNCYHLKEIKFGGTSAQWKSFELSADNINNAKVTFNVPNPQAPSTPSKTNISLSSTKLSLYLKVSTILSATVKNGSGNTTFKSSNPTIAKVDTKGKITALKAGKTTITVTNNGVSKVCVVTVKNPTLNKTSLNVRRNTSYTLKVTGGYGKAVYSSSNKNIAYVDANGKVTGRNKGTATINVKVSGITLKCKVTVVNPSLNKTSVTINKGKTFKLSVNNSYKKTTYSTSNKSVATVDSNGKITAKKKGKAVVTVKNNGVTMKCSVTVK